MVGTYDREALLVNLPDGPYRNDPDVDSNLGRVADALVTGHWSKVETRLTDIENQLAHIDKTGDVLRRFAREWDVSFSEDDSDQRVRILAQGKFKRLLGGTTPDEIVGFIAAFLQADKSDITLIENEDTSGDYVGATYRIQFSTDLLEELGFEAPFTDLVSDLDDILDAVSATGVKGTVDLVTGATYGTATYDSEDVYGS